ncbi:terminase TerL endonuclease subunit [Hutsoniella sourekii]|uniref:terminase TerL endonuclease subunit n=1 Tax=Hutsoniella sourekii TaxID=87650 RepID=UPI0004806741|nr:terminase TerL endonuclease subunit [Hutsoniella sourekii]
MITHPFVDEYVEEWRTGKIKLNQDRIDLIAYLENIVLTLEDIYFDEKQINDFVAFAEKWFFPLESFQKFLVSFVFLYFADGAPVFNIFFWTMARGAGKNGLISVLLAYFVSSLHGIPEYHAAVVANSEKQAKKSFMDIHNMLKRNPLLTDKEVGEFRNGLAQILNTQTYSTIEYLTSNADTKDSFAHGVVIFDEIHQYDNYEIINVLTDGLGKVQPPRTFYISTNGYVRDGVYDKELDKAREILKHKSFQSRVFPWICTLDDKSEVSDESNWQKANPMFHPPLSDYGDGLMRTVRDQWGEVQRGERDKIKWLTKRMNISDVQLETSVASREEILATNRQLPSDLADYYAVGGLDYASLKDFAAVGLLFKRDDEYIWLSHSFIRKEFIDSYSLAINPEIPKWEREGLLTVVDEPTIGIEHIVEWFVKMRETYDFNTVVGDNYRMDYVRGALEAEGFEIEFIRRTKSIEATVAPQIEVAFAENKLVWGKNPLMNWYTNNVFVRRDKFGNMAYEKKEENRRKIDGFMALVHAYWKGTELFPEAPEDFVFEDFWT